MIQATIKTFQRQSSTHNPQKYSQQVSTRQQDYGTAKQVNSFSSYRVIQMRSFLVLLTIKATPSSRDPRTTLAAFGETSIPMICDLFLDNDNHSAKVWHQSFHFADCAQNVEGTYQILIYVHEGTVILELPAVVRSCEDCDQLALPTELIAFLDYLMRTAD